MSPWKVSHIAHWQWYETNSNQTCCNFLKLVAACSNLYLLSHGLRAWITDQDAETTSTMETPDGKIIFPICWFHWAICKSNGLWNCFLLTPHTQLHVTQKWKAFHKHPLDDQGGDVHLKSSFFCPSDPGCPKSQISFCVYAAQSDNARTSCMKAATQNSVCPPCVAYFVQRTVIKTFLHE